MKVNKIRGLISGLPRQINRFAPGGLILMYHRIAELENDPWQMSVNPSHFEEHLEVLKKYTQPLTLSQLAEMPRPRRADKHRVAITFDDGYDDNFIHARPILERNGIPATIFIASGGIDNEREFWWDELDRILLQPTVLPQHLRLSIGGAPIEWNLAGTGEYGDARFQADRQWRATVDDDPTPRHSIYCKLYELLRFLSHDERQQVLEELREWAGLAPERRASHRSMSSGQVAALAKDGLIEIGGHTVTHPHLAAQPLEQQRQEITHGKTQVEDMAGVPINSFAYPHGHYSRATLALVREAGFRHACNSRVNKVRARTDPYQLPRVEVNNWDGEQFAEWLDGWFRLQQSG